MDDGFGGWRGAMLVMPTRLAIHPWLFFPI